MGKEGSEMIRDGIKILPLIIFLVLSTPLNPRYAFSELLPSNSLGRVSYVEGNVEVKAEDLEETVKVMVNMPILPGDLVITGEMSRVEIEMADGTRIRASSRTSFIMHSPVEEYSLPLIRLNSGRIGMRTKGNLQLVIDGPNYRVTSKGPALFHLRDEKGVAEISVKKGDISVEGNWGIKLLNDGMTAVIRDNRISTAAGIVHGGWITEFNEREVRSADYINSPGQFGQYELETYGRWIYVPVYGYIWKPYTYWGWAPYVNGHWFWRAKVGWIWISYEPWGWLPYHYGRWVYMPAWGWCWVPGTEWGLWIPGAVYWIYGSGWIAWGPLAPGEVFLFDRINVVKPINYGFPGGVVVVEKHAIIKNRIVVKPIRLPDDPLKRGRIAHPPLPNKNIRNEEIKVHRQDHFRENSLKRVEWNSEWQKGSRIIGTRERDESLAKDRFPIRQDLHRVNIENRRFERSIKNPISPGNHFGNDSRRKWQSPVIKGKSPGVFIESKNFSGSWINGGSGFSNGKRFPNMNGFQKLGSGFRSIMNPRH